MSSEQPDKTKMLPLKHQQKAFENVYLKAQEGMKLPVRPSSITTCRQLFAIPPPYTHRLTYCLCNRTQRGCSSEDREDEIFNRKATLLKSLSVVLCCSPVCEKQSLFALFQSYKENDIEEQLIKKVTSYLNAILLLQGLDAL